LKDCTGYGRRGGIHVGGVERRRDGGVTCPRVYQGETDDLGRQILKGGKGF